MDAEYQLTVILSAWDNVNTIIGVGVVYKDVSVSGGVTSEFIELCDEFSYVRKLNNRLYEQRETTASREPVETISDVDELWRSLTKTHQNIRREPW